MFSRFRQHVSVGQPLHLVMNYHRFTLQLWALTAIIKGKVINPDSINVSLSVCLSEKTYARAHVHTPAVWPPFYGTFHLSKTKWLTPDCKLCITQTSGRPATVIIPPHRGWNGTSSGHNTQRCLISSTAMIIGANKRKRQQREQITLTSIHKHRGNHLPQQLIHTYTAACLWAFLP